MFTMYIESWKKKRNFKRHKEEELKLFLKNVVIVLIILFFSSFLFLIDTVSEYIKKKEEKQNFIGQYLNKNKKKMREHLWINTPSIKKLCHDLDNPIFIFFVFKFLNMEL